MSASEHRRATRPERATAKPAAASAGVVEAIHIATAAGAPVRAVDTARALADVGLEGDRYSYGAGHYQDGRVSRDLTLIEAEAIEALAREHGIEFAPGETRRKLTTRGLGLNELVGRRFWVGQVLCQGTRLCEPCQYLADLTGKPLLGPLVHRGGLRADIISGGVIQIGDRLHAADEDGRMTRSLKIGLLHLAPELGALDENRALIESAIRLAASFGADWVISGELVVPGYRFAPLIGTEWIEEQPDLWMCRLAEISRELGVVSFVSHPERDGGSGQLFNSLFVIGRDGRLLGRHRKLHPTPGSEGWASAGEPGRPILVDGIQVGLLICADAYAPHAACRLGDDGAQLLVSSAAWWPGEWGPSGEWEARTLETGLPLIVCNRTGRDGDSDMTEAESVLVDRGLKLLTLQSPDSTVFVVDCLIRDGNITTCEVVATASVPATTSRVRVR